MPAAASSCSRAATTRCRTSTRTCPTSSTSWGFALPVDDDQRHVAPDLEVEPEQRDRAEQAPQIARALQPQVDVGNDVDQEGDHRAGAQQGGGDAENPAEDGHVV